LGASSPHSEVKTLKRAIVDVNGRTRRKGGVAQGEVFESGPHSMFGTGWSS
jgi:hypothetical protein